MAAHPMAGEDRLDGLVRRLRDLDKDLEQIILLGMDISELSKNIDRLLS